MIYEYYCEKCGKFVEEMQTLAEKHNPVCECGEVMKQKYSNFRFKFDFWYGWDEGLGKYIDNSHQRSVEMDRLNVRRIKD